MGFVSREDRIHGMLRAVQIEAERNPATALRGRLVCRGFRSGLEAVGEGKPSVAELEQLLRQEIFGTRPVPPPEEDDDD
ncbi:hypothetical protein [Pseudomonas shirazica]|uniref:hypothetical protein n=1 Tax=Pseudomonas shirazica TaxID=1940636 RepID=UPI001119F97B|nr:hypothetical protein [Pseudomonas shirazica]